MTVPRPLIWNVGFTRDPAVAPEQVVPATVPGAVQLDWAKAHGWPDVQVGDHWREYGWMEDVYWLYRARVELPSLAGGERLFFVCHGVDYRFQIRLDGVVLHEQEGMFTRCELDLTERLAVSSTLEVLVWPAPKSCVAPADRNQANASCKPAVSYGWDFHPRLIPLGIWDDTYLEIRPACHLRDAELRYTLAPDFSSVYCTLELALSQPGTGTVRWQLLDPAGQVALSREVPADAHVSTLAARLAAPTLWWPNGQGTPALYTSQVTLHDADGRERQRLSTRVGFRTVRLVMAPGQWDRPANDRFPKPRTEPPITLEVNGRQIFAKGSNWAPADIFPGRLTAADYDALLTLAHAAHFNLLRCWGGAPVQKDAFFARCDELGLLVWQEFPLACNRYEGTPAYLRVLDQESRSLIARLRHHACLALWCGGNELFNNWSGMTDQDLPLRLLNRNCYDLDPQRPFLPTSPIMGMGHGHYVFRNEHGDEVYQLFARAACTAYTEFGAGGPASAAALRRVIPSAELWPVRPGTAWETHHAVKAWAPNSHLLLDVIEDYFGPCATLEELVERGQLLQSEGLKCLFEEARRQKPRASMALNWCYNEPWITAANLSILTWPATPKPAYYGVQSACRPVLASARLPQYRWHAGELFNPELWLLNDRPTALPAGRIEATLELGNERLLLLAWDYPAAPANTNLPGPTARLALPAVAGVTRLTLVLRVVGQPTMDSRYELCYVPPAAPASATAPVGAKPLNQ